MIYSKNNSFHHLPFTAFQTLDQCKFQSDDVFYHHHYHEQQNNTPIYDCLEEAHWEHMRKNKSVKLFHENCGETFSFRFLNEVESLLILRKIDPSQLYFVVIDETHRYYLEEGLRLMGITGVNVGVNNLFLRRLSFFDIAQHECEYKFSSLSRNYRTWRLQLYTKLLESGSLDHFVYSFYNIHPYDNITFSIDTIKEDLTKLELPLTDKVNMWVEAIPHKLDSADNVLNKWGDVTYKTIMSADFHLVIETHYDLFYYVPTLDGTFYKGLAPSFITEKVYKGIACEKPFLVFGTPFMLEDIRKLGFETFAPFIDETYDTISDNQKRLNTLVEEIDRLVNLPTAEYQAILTECKKIAQRNLQKLIVLAAPKQWDIRFEFIRKYISTDENIQIF
jgi:hypothetical protein